MQQQPKWVSGDYNRHYYIRQDGVVIASVDEHENLGEDSLYRVYRHLTAESYLVLGLDNAKRLVDGGFSDRV